MCPVTVFTGRESRFLSRCVGRQDEGAPTFASFVERRVPLLASVCVAKPDSTRLERSAHVAFTCPSS